MKAEGITHLFLEAWRGIDGKSNADRVRSRYLYRLREAKTAELRRAVCAELLCEGLLMIGGSPNFQGADACLDLWRFGESDEWRIVRDCAMLAATIRWPR